MPKGSSRKLRVKIVEGGGEGEVVRARLSWWREAVRDFGGGLVEGGGLDGEGRGTYVDHLC